MMCKRGDCAKSSDHACEKCKKKCANESCLEIHKKLCAYKFQCNNCSKYSYGYQHVCENECKFCENCKTSVSCDHRCYVKPDKPSRVAYAGYIFYDYEAGNSISNTHVPN